MIKLSELKTLPFITLAAMALSVAKQMDAGRDDGGLLERLFSAIKTAPR